MKKALSSLWEFIKIAVVALVIVAPIRYFLFQPFLVKGQSMEPNFENGDYLIVDEISYRFREPQRGEVIVFKYPPDPSQRFIKRVIGLPGEEIEVKEDKVSVTHGDKTFILREDYLPSDLATVGDLKISLKEGEYFVLGDNRFFSFDSRRFGIVPRESIIGRVFLRAWPFNDFSMMALPQY